MRAPSSSAALLVLLAACGALRENPLGGDDDDSPLPDLDASTDGAAREPDAALADAAPDAKVPAIREDVACVGANAWYVTDRTAECESRKLRLVQATPPDAAFPHGNLDIAWSLSARVGIVLAWETGVEAGYLQALTFDTASEAFTVRPDRVLPPFDFQVEGAGARIAARADGSFDVLSMLDESQNGGDVFLRRLPVNQPFLEPDVVFTGAYRSGQLGLLVHPNGVVTATAAVTDESDLAIQTKQRQPEATTFETFAGNLGYYLQGPGDNGNHRMALDPLGVAHIAYEQGFAETRSQPRYARVNGSAWDFRRTVDNPTADGLSGGHLSIAVFGDEKNVVYVHQARTDAGDLLPYAQIVRARWRGDTQPIERSVLRDHLPLGNGAFADDLSGVTAAAAMDASGAMHVVYARRIDADAASARCQVHYLREASRDGALELLDDELSPELPCTNDPPPVALAVEPGGRPHIAYLSAAQGVVYATRYDR